MAIDEIKMSNLTQIFHKIFYYLSRFSKIILLIPTIISTITFYRGIVIYIAGITDPAIYFIISSGSIFVFVLLLLIKFILRTNAYAYVVQCLNEITYRSRRIFNEFGVKNPNDYDLFWHQETSKIIKQIAEAMEKLLHQRPIISIKKVYFYCKDDFCPAAYLKHSVDEDWRKYIYKVIIRNMDDISDPSRTRHREPPLDNVVLHINDDKKTSFITETQNNPFYKCWETGKSYICKKLGSTKFYHLKNIKNLKSEYDKEYNRYKAAIIGPICFKSVILNFLTIGFVRKLTLLPKSKIKFLTYFIENLNDILRINLVLNLVNNAFLDKSRDNLVNYIQIRPEDLSKIAALFRMRKNDNDNLINFRKSDIISDVENENNNIDDNYEGKEDDERKIVK